MLNTCRKCGGLILHDEWDDGWCADCGTYYPAVERQDDLKQAEFDALWEDHS